MFSVECRLWLIRSRYRSIGLIIFFYSIGETNFNTDAAGGQTSDQETRNSSYDAVRVSIYFLGLGYAPPQNYTLSLTRLKELFMTKRLNWPWSNLTKKIVSLLRTDMEYCFIPAQVFKKKTWQQNVAQNTTYIPQSPRIYRYNTIQYIQ